MEIFNMSNTNDNQADFSPAMERLNALRENAEKHLDEAQEALFDDSVSDEEALAHLDAALSCVKDMLPKDLYEDETQAA